MKKEQGNTLSDEGDGALSSFSFPLSSLFSFSHYPAIPAPLQLPLAETPEHPCSYLPGRLARLRAFAIDRLPADLYHAFMDAGFRRSGKMIYQPTCRGCRACTSIRVPVDQFQPSKSQRRCWNKNGDISVKIQEPRATDEKFDLYCRYLTHWHHREEPDDREAFEEFLYQSPVQTIEMEYRGASGGLIGVGISDVCASSISSVYFYFDPAEAWRSLGTFSIMKEIEFARLQKVSFLYLGYWIVGCGKMEYKSRFQPCEILGGDGKWRPLGKAGTRDVAATSCLL